MSNTIVSSLLNGLKISTPFAYYVIKYWYVVIFLIGLVLGTAAYMYHKYTVRKLDAVRVELADYKSKSEALEKAFQHIQEDINAAILKAKDFETDIVEIRKANLDLRSRVNGLSTKIPIASDNNDEAQRIVDELRNDIINKWENLGKKNVEVE